MTSRPDHVLCRADGPANPVTGGRPWCRLPAGHDGTHLSHGGKEWAAHAPGCTTAPHPDRECAPELDRLSDPHDCEPTDDGAACRTCGLPAERDDITPAELVALVASIPVDVFAGHANADETMAAAAGQELRRRALAGE